ncbi:MAG: galactose mutarotase-like domain-containing protein [Benjaminiella poitrasii]|nr:MAG: galactose mutarotase-like domain-containing protein [Benjaminiella poitrasii]
MPATKSNNKSIFIEHSSGSKVEVALYGSTVLSWIVDGEDRLFTSKKAFRDGSRAIRGGLPICWPVFGFSDKVKLPKKHGFARDYYWDYLGIEKDDQDEVVARFGLKHTKLTEQVKKAFPYVFELIYTVTLSAKSLKTFLTVKNEDKESFDFNYFTHTYFAVPDVRKSSIDGLTNIEYLDVNIPDAKPGVEKRQKVTLDSEIERMYKKTPDTLLLQRGNGTAMKIEKNNLKDTVVWNPWIESSNAMDDFEDDEWEKMICIMEGTVSELAHVASGQSWTGGQTFTVL